ncbi:Hypothetical protein, putative [Bodo saltans]|uniref:Uncharacterized protein n=2 Tax=Bodo saltans TaxID=75058 RepID=A0A0S4KHV0_BODSA|nr:Hypothetical protein, putative [Bodo saltans]|eukprot:CUI14111.1 Hypothetical protein, putative [Bodo saltans]
MASFFDDDEGETQKKPKKHRDDKKKSNVAAPTISAHVTSPAEPQMQINRFLISTDDAAAAELRRRNEVSESLSHRAAPAAGGLSDSLAKNMEEAQKRRERERDDALIQKVKREREEESLLHPELVEKDLMIGVFVTAAYKAKVAAHIRSRNGSDDSFLQLGSDQGGEEDEVQFSGTMNALTTSGVYETNTHRSAAPVSTKTNSSSRGVGHSNDSLTDDPTLASEMSASSDEKLTKVSAVTTAGEASLVQRSAVEEAEHNARVAKAAAREARRSRQIDATMLEAMRKRFEQRQQQNLLLHRSYVASS